MTLGECAALAMWMTWKCALMSLPVRRREGRRRCDPRSLSPGELERLTRRFTSELLPIIGPKEDIPAPDMGTNEQTMAWMMDTYSMKSGYAVPEIVTGQADLNRRLRRPARGDRRGVVMVIEPRVRSARLERSPSSAASCRGSGTSAASLRRARTSGVQGHRRLRRLRRASTPRRGSTFPPFTSTWASTGRSKGATAGVRVTNEELLELDCDILVLAAREDQLTAENAPRVRARMIAEGANGPTSIEADAILWDRGIPILPDVLTNAGGVTVSYFEWVQDLGRLFWTRDEIRAKLAEKLSDAFDRVWNISTEREVPLRTGALVTGIREVSDALEARGIFP